MYIDLSYLPSPIRNQSTMNSPMPDASELLHILYPPLLPEEIGMSESWGRLHQINDYEM